MLIPVKPAIQLLALLIAGAALSSCSALPEDFRAALPESVRGDTKALTDYPTPDLSGSWSDKDYPELNISLSQNGNAFSLSRTGTYKGSLQLEDTFNGTLEGRSVEATYKSVHQGKIRPLSGKCFGVASKDSSELNLTCEDSDKGSYPLRLIKN